MKTLDRVKSEELFNRIKSLGNTVQHMAGVVQNPDFINEDNAYENYLEFRKRYHSIAGELSAINGAVAKLHMEIDKNKNHHYGMVR